MGRFGDAESAIASSAIGRFGDGTFRRRYVSATGRFGDRRFGDGTFRRQDFSATDAFYRYFVAKNVKKQNLTGNLGTILEKLIRKVLPALQIG